MTIRDIVVALGFKIDRNSERDTENRIKGIKNLATKLLGVIGIGFSIAGISNLAETAAEAEALKSQFSQVFGEMEQEAASKLEAIEADTGVLVNRMKGSFTQIAAFSKTAGVEQADALALANRSMIAVADSAAFYDRSIEDVTNSLQSFLKGNFENDAALGLSCTETTRNIAANNLYGKSFKDLSEAEKQFTLLSMVEEANKASGALGQAARESDTWTNQLGNLKQSLTDLKAAVGSTFLKPAVVVLKVLNSLVQKVTTAVEGLTRENEFLTRVTERYHALVKRLQPAIERMTQTFSNGLKKGISVVKGVVEQLGGMENIWRALAVTAGAFFLVMNWKKMLSGAQLLIKLLLGIGKMFSFAHLKILAVVTLIAVLALAIEDFVHFLMGHDSVIGTVFEKIGIDAENVRETIVRVWQKVSVFLANIWSGIKNLAVTIFTVLKDAVFRHMDSIRESVTNIWNGIQTVLSVVWGNISGLAEVIFGTLLAFFGGWQLDLESVFDAIASAVDVVLGVFGSIGDWISNHKGMMDTFVIILGSIAAAFGVVQAAIAAYNIIAGICTTVSTVMAGGFGIASAAGGALAGVIAFITSPIIIAVAAIAALIAIGVLLYKNWDTIKEFMIHIWNTIKNVLRTILEGIAGFFISIWTSICHFFQGIWNGIVSVVTKCIHTIINIITAILRAIQSIWTAVWEGIRHFFQGIWSGIVSFITGCINTITSVITTVLGMIQSIWNAVWEGVRHFFQGIWNGMVSFVTGCINTVTSVITMVLGMIQSIWITIWEAISSVFIGIWNGMVAFLSGIWNTILGVISDAISGAYRVIVSVLSAIWDFFCHIFGMIADFVRNLFQIMLSGITNTITMIKDAIINGLTTAIDWIKGLPSQALQWGADIIQGIANGITGAISKVTDAVSGVAGKIKSFLHFSVPDEGPLTDYESWMPDFMNGLAEGIRSQESVVLNPIRELAEGITMLTQAATVKAATAAASTVNHRYSSVTQNVNISNRYSGGTMEAQKNVSKAMKQSAEDATSYMARGLAYARG